MGVGKTNIDLDGQLTNFPGQTQRVEAQGLAQLVASSSRPLVVAATKFLHWRHQALDELRIRERAHQPTNPRTMVVHTARHPIASSTRLDEWEHRPGNTGLALITAQPLFTSTIASTITNIASWLGKLHQMLSSCNRDGTTIHYHFTI